jgi:hypothetical protein
METPLSPPTLKNKEKKQWSLEEILHFLGPITGVSYNPFKPEAKQEARPLLPPNFSAKPHLFDYFSLFFT